MCTLVNRVCGSISLSFLITRSTVSARALKFMTIYSTSNLPKLLSRAKEEGWRILGAAAEVPYGARDYSSASASTSTTEDSSWDLESDDVEANSGVVKNEDVGQNVQQQQQRCLDLHKVEAGSPTILVLGSEGEFVC